MILTTQAQLREAIHKPGQGLYWQCGNCGKTEELGAHEGCGTGYGYATNTPDAKPICYECCGKRDAATMRETGRATLYLTGGEVTNWPGTLRFKANVRKGHHNIARTRYDVWFTDADGARWHGVQYGENTQICHCRRLKSK